MLAKNSETVGWIKVNNTNVNYSIVQHSDNEYYLKHDFNNRYNIYGWVYGDFRDDFEYGKSSKVILEIEEIKWKEHKRWIKNVR